MFIRALRRSIVLGHRLANYWRFTNLSKKTPTITPVFFVWCVLYRLNSAARLFAADVITQNLACRQRPDAHSLL